jgi:hypothetical protein
MLNPGDMFSVDQDQVLFATGIQKKSLKKKKGASKAIEGEEEGEAKEGEGEVEVEVEEEEDEEGYGKEEQRKRGAEAVEAGGLGEAEETPANNDHAEPIERVETEEERKRREAMENLKALRKDPNNILDMSKAYATPWRPREYMAPFAFIPRYLEVCGHSSMGCDFFVLKYLGQSQYLPCGVSSPSGREAWIS